MEQTDQRIIKHASTIIENCSMALALGGKIWASHVLS